MYIAELEAENFRIFGEGDDKLKIEFSKGVTAIVGGNGYGKTAIIDALRLVLGTSDLEFYRVILSDFNVSAGEPKNKFKIRCKFVDLSVQDRGAFAEYLTYEDGDTAQAVLYLTFIAHNQKIQRHGRPFITTEIRSGKDADGPVLDANARSLVAATYMRPLRDAEREMSAGRGSRLSQILLNTEEINNPGSEDYSADNPNPDPRNLSVLDLGDYTNDQLKKHRAIQGTQTRINSEYLAKLSFEGDANEGQISIGFRGDDRSRLRQLLEKLELQLSENGASDHDVKQGLGANNLLYMACELLLLGEDKESTPLLLIEEPEAHLHPQRQLLLTQFLKEQAERKDADIQIILTTHSPNLASVIKLDNLVLMQKGLAYSLAHGKTQLVKSDYRFLERFLDVTKANLFFARGVMIVEGDAENILLPVLARLLGKDFTKHGISVVNVGGVGLGRYARVFMRHDTNEPEINVPVACVTDLDVMPDCAPLILGKVKADIAKENWPEKRRWRVKSDFPNPNDGKTLNQYKKDKATKVSGQGVKTFVSDEWTLEYDLAASGLAKYVFVAAKLALSDDKICSGEASIKEVYEEALIDFKDLADDDTRASRIYALFARSEGTKASKAIAAQYLAELLMRKKNMSPALWRDVLPDYLVSAIDHITSVEGDFDIAGDVNDG